MLQACPGSRLQELIHLALAIELDSMPGQQLRRHTLAGDHLPGKAPIIDAGTAAGGAALLEQGFAGPLSRLQSPLRPGAECRRHIRPGPGEDLVPHPLGGDTGRGQAAQLLRADGDQLVTRPKRLRLRDGIAAAVIPAGLSQQAGGSSRPSKAA